MGKKIVALLTILAIIFTVAIFTPDSNAGIQTLNLSKQTKEIKVGESFQLTMTGVKASSIKWKSSKPGVATVSKKGVIKGVKAGTTNITGKYKSLKFTIKVNVVTKTTTTQNTTESTTENTTESKIPTTEQYWGSCGNIDLYYITVLDGDELIVKAYNKNNFNAYIYFDYINIDDKTVNLGNSYEIMANNSRTLSIYKSSGIPKPKNSISGLVEAEDKDYNRIEKSNINARVK